MRDLTEGMGLVMLSHNGLVKVLGVKAYMKGTIRLADVCKGWYPFSRPWGRGYNTLGDHVIDSAFYLLSVLYGYLPLGMLYWEDGRVGPDGICARQVVYSVEWAGEGSLQGNDVLGHHWGQGVVLHGSWLILASYICPNYLDPFHTVSYE